MTSEQRRDLRNYSYQSTAQGQKSQALELGRGHRRGWAESRQEQEGKEEPAAEGTLGGSLVITSQ